MNNVIQDLTNLNTQIDEINAERQKKKYIKQRVIEWYARKDLIYFDEEKLRPTKRSSLTDLSKELNISRQTIYDWSKSIPNFKQEVDEARNDIIQSNINSVWNSVYMTALKGDFKSMVLYLNTYDPSFINPFSVRRQKNSNSNLNSSKFIELFNKHNLQNQKVKSL